VIQSTPKLYMCLLFLPLLNVHFSMHLCVFYPVPLRVSIYLFLIRTNVRILHFFLYRGFLVPQRIAETLAKTQPNAEQVLDLGCGTGLSGEALQAANFKSLAGLDISQKSLDLVASKKPDVYRRLIQGNLENTLPFKDHEFDGVVSVGVFSYVENFAMLFSEIVRISKPNGIVAFSHRKELWDDDYRGCVTAAKALEESGKWACVQIGEPEPYMPQNPDPTESAKTIRVIVYKCT
jgi:SAM-dependent methyltransferase